MEQSSRHFLIYRFSALGDVAIAAPLIKYYASNNPNDRFTIVTQAKLSPLFKGVDNLHVYAVETKKQHKGLMGLWRLSRELLRLKPTHVADIHSVLRTHILRKYHLLSGLKYQIIDKGREEKKILTKDKDKRVYQLKTSMARYEDVLVRLGLDNLSFSDKKFPLSRKQKIESSHKFVVGIAPFAKHKGKEWPADKMEKLIEKLSLTSNIDICLFGGGKREEEIFDSWCSKYKNVTSYAGKLSFEMELEHISQLDLMLCMDSANMHFASALGVPVISIWGATHPFLGFYGWNQDLSMAVQLDLECRPCSVFGNRDCYRGDYACLNGIKPQVVFDKILEFFK